MVVVSKLVIVRILHKFHPPRHLPIYSERPGLPGVECGLLWILFVCKWGNRLRRNEQWYLGQLLIVVRCYTVHCKKGVQRRLSFFGMCYPILILVMCTAHLGQYTDLLWYSSHHNYFVWNGIHDAIGSLVNKLKSVEEGWLHWIGTTEMKKMADWVSDLEKSTKMIYFSPCSDCHSNQQFHLHR